MADIQDLLIEQLVKSVLACILLMRAGLAGVPLDELEKLAVVGFRLVGDGFNYMLGAVVGFAGIVETAIKTDMQVRRAFEAGFLETRLASPCPFCPAAMAIFDHCHNYKLPQSLLENQEGGTYLFSSSSFSKRRPGGVLFHFATNQTRRLDSFPLLNLRSSKMSTELNPASSSICFAALSE